MAKRMMRRKSMKKMMRKKARKTVRKMKRVSKIAKGRMQRRHVFTGKKVKTQTGLKKSDLKMNKRGKIVSVKQSKASKRKFEKNGLKKWSDALKKARKVLRIQGFVPVGGKSKEGQQLLKKVKSFL